MDERPTLRKLTGSVALLSTGAMALAAAGFLEGNPGWVAPWVAIAAFYGALTWGLFTGRLWAPALAQGAALLGAGVFAQSIWAFEGVLLATGVGLGLHLLLGLLALGLDDGLSKRQRWSLRFAGAALVPAALFALAPDQRGWVMVAVIGGAAMVWLGALGVARGRTWGVLAALFGGPTLAIGVAFAPDLAFFQGPHFLVDRPLLPLMLDVLGLTAAIAGLLAVAPFALPMARFLVGRPAR